MSSQSDQYWEVEEILKESTHRYLVRWKGVDPETNKPWPDSWVPKRDCTELLVLDWRAKKDRQKRRGRPSKKLNDDKRKVKRRSRSISVEYRTPDNTSTSNSISNSNPPPTKVPPYVEVPRISKRKSKVADHLPSDTDGSEEVRPRKRRKATEEDEEAEEPPAQKSATVKVGPPGRAKQYVIDGDKQSIPNVLHEKRKKSKTGPSRSTSESRRNDASEDEDVAPVVPRKHREKEAPQKPSNSRHSSTNLTNGKSKSKNKSASRSRSVNTGEVDSRSPVPPKFPTVVERSPPKASRHGSSQEIIPETTQQQSSSSQSHHALPRPARPLHYQPQAITSRPTLITSRAQAGSPIRSSPSRLPKLSRAEREKLHAELFASAASNVPRDVDEPIREEVNQVDFGDWLHERHEEEETQSQPIVQQQQQQRPLSETNGSNKAKASVSVSVSDLPAPTAIAYNTHKPIARSGGVNALTDIYGRLGKVFSRRGSSRDMSDPIVTTSSHPAPSAPISQPLSTSDNVHAVDEENGESETPDISKSFDTAIDELDEHDELVGDDIGFDNPINNVNNDEEEEDQLGPDDAPDADAADSSVIDSQSHAGINTSTMANPAQTPQTPQPMIQSNVRQLNSAISILHRKSEENLELREENEILREKNEAQLKEIEAQRDKIDSVQEDLKKARLEMTRLDKDLDHSEDLRDAQLIRISQLEAELMAARGEAAANVMQRALSSQSQRQSEPPPLLRSRYRSQSQPSSRSRSPSRHQHRYQFEPQSQTQSRSQSSQPADFVSRSPEPQMQPNPDSLEHSGLATELISTPTTEWVELYQREIETFKNSVVILEEAVAQKDQEIETLQETVVQRDNEINIFRSLYLQSSTSHADNLEELRRVKRENDSLRIQVSNGVRQNNVFYKVQLDALSKRLKGEEVKTKLMEDQLRATQKIRDDAGLLPKERKKIEGLLLELEAKKDEIGRLGMENTKLRIALKERDDAELARHRENRKAEERALEMEEEDGLLWVCQWREEDHIGGKKCGAVLHSRDALREHFFAASHIE